MGALAGGSVVSPLIIFGPNWLREIRLMQHGNRALSILERKLSSELRPAEREEVVAALIATALPSATHRKARPREKATGGMDVAA